MGLNELYDTYEGKRTDGEIVTSPSIHIYIAHQIQSTVEEGKEYVPPNQTNNVAPDENATDSEENTANKVENARKQFVSGVKHVKTA